jgi:phage N-6-adenine-methyltransferase
MEPPLSQLADRINASHRAYEAAATTALRHAVEAGRLLLQAKGALPHGDWLPWLSEHVDCSIRSAQLYMQLARESDAGSLNAQRVAHLALRDAAREVATPRNTDIETLTFSEVWHDGDEWYTPPDYVDAARSLMGRIDLDPASCETAQVVVQATRFYAKADDGLRKPWHGRVWVNPPYSLVDVFAEKLLTECDSGRVEQAVMLVNASTDTVWFQTLAERFPVLFTRGRIRFWHPEHPGEQPRYGQALFGVGVNSEVFASAYAALTYAPNGSLMTELSSR